MIGVYNEIHKPEFESLDALRGALGALIASRDVDDFIKFQSDYGHIPVWVDDPTRQYPLRRHNLAELRAEVGYGINRIYWQDVPENTSPSQPPREFTLRPENLLAITRSLSEENIE